MSEPEFKNPYMPGNSTRIKLEGDDEWYCIGLTKREHFAGLALQGILSSEYISSFCKEDTVCPAAASKAAVNYADALLRELN